MFTPLLVVLKLAKHEGGNTRNQQSCIIIISKALEVRDEGVGIPGPVTARRMSWAMDDGVKAFSTARRAGQMVVALAVGWGRECVAFDQVPHVQKTTERHLFAPSYPAKSIKVRADRAEREADGRG